MLKKMNNLEMNDQLLALWDYCKSKADDEGVPSPIIGKIAEGQQEEFEKLLEIRENIKSFIKNKTSINRIRELLKSRAPEDLYLEIVSHIKRRELGQFWTPRPIAERMVTYSKRTETIFDVGTGSGLFLMIAARMGFKRLMGIEISPVLIDLTRYNLIGYDGKVKLIWGDFIVTDNLPEADLWISNPPYTRHHQISCEAKEEYIKVLEKDGLHLSRISSMYMYFFGKFLIKKDKWTQASFICPRSLYDSVHSLPLKEKLKEMKVLHVVEVFDDQRIFRDVETGPAISYLTSNTNDVITFRNSVLLGDSVKVMGEYCRNINELDNSLPWSNIAVGAWKRVTRGIKLKMIFKIMRGIATGANRFFVINEEKRRKFKLPDSVLQPVIAKTRYCLKDRFTREDWERLKREGKEVYLVDLSKDPYHPAVQAYIRRGEEEGIPRRALVQTRRRWYEMERRELPVIFVTYLSRGRPRFILNEAGVLPLNVFLCLIPKISLSKKTIHRIWSYLNSDDAFLQFKQLARNYGEDTLKIEPRLLDELEVPYEVLGEERRYLLNKNIIFS